MTARTPEAVQLQHRTAESPAPRGAVYRAGCGRAVARLGRTALDARCADGTCEERALLVAAGLSDEEVADLAARVRAGEPHDAVLRAARAHAPGTARLAAEVLRACRRGAPPPGVLLAARLGGVVLVHAGGCFQLAGAGREPLGSDGRMRSDGQWTRAEGYPLAWGLSGERLWRVARSPAQLGAAVAASSAFVEPGLPVEHEDELAWRSLPAGSVVRPAVAGGGAAVRVYVDEHGATRYLVQRSKTWVLGAGAQPWGRSTLWRELGARDGILEATAAPLGSDRARELAAYVAALEERRERAEAAGAPLVPGELVYPTAWARLLPGSVVDTRDGTRMPCVVRNDLGWVWATATDCYGPEGRPQTSPPWGDTGVLSDPDLTRYARLGAQPRAVYLGRLPDRPTGPAFSAALAALYFDAGLAPSGERTRL